MSADGDRAIAALARALVAERPRDAARALRQVSPGEVVAVLEPCSPAESAAVLLELEVYDASRALLAGPPAWAAALVETVTVPRAASWLRVGPSEASEAVLAALPKARARAVRAALAQPSGSAGALADPLVIAFAPDLEAEAALAELRARSAVDDDRVYLVDAAQRLRGAVPVAALIAAAPATPLSELGERNPVWIGATESVSAAKLSPGWSRWRSLPVCERDGAFVGALRYEDALRAAEPGGVSGDAAAGLTIALAELLWMGLAGMTEGLARVVTPRSEER